MWKIAEIVATSAITFAVVVIFQWLVSPIVKKLEAIRLLLDELVQVSRRERGGASYFSTPTYPASKPNSEPHAPDQVLRGR